MQIMLLYVTIGTLLLLLLGGGWLITGGLLLVVLVCLFVVTAYRLRWHEKVGLVSIALLILREYYALRSSQQT